MTTTEDPEVFAEKWHEYLDSLDLLKASISPDKFEDFDEAVDTLRDFVDEEAERMEEDDE